MRALRLPIGEVLSSPYCRAVETARLLFGRAEVSMDVLVRSGADGQPDYGPLLRLVGAAPAPGTLRVIIAHNAPRIAYLEEGETAIVRPAGPTFEVLAQLNIDAWARLPRG
jgi:phosphohistidine phosphatase SixA